MTCFGHKTEDSKTLFLRFQCVQHTSLARRSHQNINRLKAEVHVTHTLRAIKAGIPPTVEEKDEIANALAETDQKVAIATRKKAQLQDLFLTLLHELMAAKTAWID